MSHVPALRLTIREFIAVIVITAFALVLRAWLQIELLQHGAGRPYAADLSYLAVFPLLVAMLWIVLRSHAGFVGSLFSLRDLTWRLALAAVAVGVLMRVAWWSQLVARVSFGWTRGDNPSAIVGPDFAFACPPPLVIGLGVLVMAVLVPVVEEIVHRGVIQSALVHHGRLIAIGTSALLFAAFHTPSSYVFVFFFGIVFGLQFWHARTLWASVITHATYNGLVQLDWRCASSQWNPPGDTLPLTGTGATAIGVLAFSLVAVAWLVMRHNSGARDTPRR